MCEFCNRTCENTKRWGCLVYRQLRLFGLCCSTFLVIASTQVCPVKFVYGKLEVHKKAVTKTYIIGEVLVMVSRELKETVLEAVDNQLNGNDPKCTTGTFGHSEKTMAELIDRIKCDPDRIFPEEELAEIIARKEEAIPLLMAFLEEVRDNAEQFSNNFDYLGHIYAVLLLAQFRVKEAYPIVLELFSLPNGLTDKLFGDAMTDYAGRIMASICGNDVASIKQLVEDEEVDKYIKVEALTALAILTLNGELERQELMAYYKELLPTIDNPTILTLLINLCTDIYPGEVYDEIKEAYKNDKVDSFLIGMGSVDQAMVEGQSMVLYRAERDRNLQKIDDTIGEMRNWAYFENEEDSAEENYFEQLTNNNLNFVHQPKVTPIVNEPKIGRNDPCPCGSGKKYKRCCGK